MRDVIYIRYFRDQRKNGDRRYLAVMKCDGGLRATRKTFRTARQAVFYGKALAERATRMRKAVD